VFSLPHHRHRGPHFRRQLSPHEQTEILSDLQHNHRFNQQNVVNQRPSTNIRQPFSNFQQQQQFPQQLSQPQNLVPTQQAFFNQQQPQFQQPLSTQQSPSQYIQPPSPLSTQQSPIIQSLQHSPLSSPQFSSLFLQQQQQQKQQPSFQIQNQHISNPPSPIELSLRNSPLSNFQEQGIFSQPTRGTLQSPVSTQQSPLTTQSKEIFSQTQFSTQQTAQKTLLPTQQSQIDEIKTNPQKEIVNTEFTIEKSVSDPDELKRIQELELKREKERRERLIKLQEEHLKMLKEENERRLKARQEEEKRDEERRLKFLEELKRIEEEKARRRKQEEEERQRLIEEAKERERKRQEEEKLRLLKEEKERQKKLEEERLRKIEEEKERIRKEEEEKIRKVKEQEDEEKEQLTTNSGVIYSQPPTQQPTLTSINILQQSNQTRSRQRARLLESTSGPEGLLLQDERQKLYLQLKESQKQQPNDEKQQTQETQRLVQRQDLLRQLKLAVANAATPANEDQIVPGPIEISGGNSSAPLFLANGQKIQIIQSPRQGRPVDIIPKNIPISASPVPTTTQRPPRALFEELTKGVLPPGADFEVIRHKQDGGLEEIGKQLPKNLPEKKVTFVFLEEQSDGTFKVKGVKGNNNGEADTNQPPAADVDSIIKKIQDGDLKLPEHTKSSPAPQNSSPNTESTSVFISQYSSTPNSITTLFPPNKYSPSPIPQYTTSVPKPRPKEPFLPTNPTYVNQKNTPTHNKDMPIPGIIYANPDVTSSHGSRQREYQQNDEAPSLKTPTRVAAPFPQNSIREQDKVSPLDENGSVDYHTKVEPPQSLAEALKKEGLYAMSRFIRESGLNNILNDTGPYTVFAPTDKAFRALLVQLGGPEKAEEKFKENPRLLSGLLLHHVIPGAFEVSSLQDEMTGVSLAGTQLRVNTYNAQDVEWNNVQVVTINGARVSREKYDIPIPQGIAHAVDKVMFPLPVGNILQTLKSDRERRFTRFLRAIQSSGLSETFSGNKVYTLFAPTDRAFTVVDDEDLETLLTDRDMARALVLRHTTPGTLFSAGMRFYQLRDSMEKGSTITIHKTNGQVKANNANIITHNVPTTNGVIHAIDGLL
ncbi:hypothetical protein L9F63_018180, partial [Diploptera punctata]